MRRPARCFHSVIVFTTYITIPGSNNTTANRAAVEYPQTIPRWHCKRHGVLNDNFCFMASSWEFFTKFPRWLSTGLGCFPWKGFRDKTCKFLMMLSWQRSCGINRDKNWMHTFLWHKIILFKRKGTFWLMESYLERNTDILSYRVVFCRIKTANYVGQT